MTRNRLARLAAALCLIAVAAASIHLFLGRRDGSYAVTPVNGKMEAAIPDRQARMEESQGDVDVRGHEGNAPTTERDVRQDWASRLAESKDNHEFIASASVAAIMGDGEAAFHVGEALMPCLLIIQSYRGRPESVEALRTEYLAAAPGVPQWVRDRSERNFDRCIRLARDNPFHGLGDMRPDYDRPRYWHNMARELGDPLAKVMYATRSLADIGSRKLARQEKSEAIAGVERDIRDVFVSGNPAALYRVGMLLADPRYSNDPLRGIAISLAACEMGYDCSASNPLNTFATCRESGECPQDARFSDIVQRGIGAEKFGKTYARAIELKELVSRKEWDAIEAYMKISGSIR